VTTQDGVIRPNAPVATATVPWLPVSVARARVRFTAIVALLGFGAVLRIWLLAALPRFFGPGDPATYFAMATGVLRHGAPRVDFVWNYTSLPGTISHIESYYEAAYAYLLAGAMSVFGAKAVVGCAMSVVFGSLAPALTYVFARRFGPRVAWVAAAIVALEPWSIYYSGVLMKEALVSVIVILSIEGLRRLILSSRSGEFVGFAAAAVVLAAAAFQYEMLPILAAATAITLALTRRNALPAYLLATTAVVGLTVAGTLAWLGVPISGKFGFFLGHRLWTTEAHGPSSYASPLGLARYLPVPYVLGALLIKWYVPIVVLAWIGSRSKFLVRTDLVLPIAFTGCYLYFHGVPHDLWERDFVPLLPVLAPFAALGVCRSELWGAPFGRRWPGLRPMSRGAVATAMIAATLIGVTATYTLHVAGTFPARWMPWSVLTVTLVLLLLLVLVLHPLSFGYRLKRVRRVIPALSLGVVLAAYSQSLPWPWIYANPQFPAYESQRAGREDACALLAGTDPSAPVMAELPAEVHLYSGHPTVLLPITHDLPTIESLQRRYAVRYLLAKDTEVAPDVAAALSLQPIAHRFGYMLYAFPNGRAALHPAPPRVDPAVALVEPALPAPASEAPPVSAPAALPARAPEAPSEQ
jgi:hypothetical protein